jgi:cyclin C
MKLNKEVEHNIKMFPNDSHKLGEMEFYLLEDLDFHLVVFHPYRSLLAMTGREPSDGGKFGNSRVDEDRVLTGRSAVGTRGRVQVGTGVGVEEEAGGESEGARIKRLMGRGSGEGLMEIDEGVLQLSMWVSLMLWSDTLIPT